LRNGLIGKLLAGLSVGKGRLVLGKAEDRRQKNQGDERLGETARMLFRVHVSVYFPLFWAAATPEEVPGLQLRSNRHRE
jgi:hypothetical protein